MLQLNASDFRKQVDELAQGKDHNAIFNYLRTTGMIVSVRDGLVNVDEDYLEKLKFLLSTVETGDVVWVGTQGLLLVVDKHPKVNNDGHHFRALRVTADTDGVYHILGDLRSIIIDDNETFRIKHTSFDIAQVESLSYERYNAYTRITQINETLSKLEEKNNG